MTLNRIIYKKKERAKAAVKPRFKGQSLTQLIRETKKSYAEIGTVFCPILNQTIHFNAEGYNHLLYESYNHPRPPAEQILKLKCFPFVVSVIKNCYKKVSVRPAARKIKGIRKNGFAYELIHEVVKGGKVRVIIEKLGNGQYNYRGVMPHDKKSKRALEKQKSTR